MTTGGFGTGRSHPDPARLFFSILKLVSFKKLTGRDGDGKILKLAPFTFYFCFYFKIFIFLYLIFYFYYIKINIFHKNKNIMNFYKLFIKNIIIIIIIYIKV